LARITLRWILVWITLWRILIPWPRVLWTLWLLLLLVRVHPEFVRLFERQCGRVEGGKRIASRALLRLVLLLSGEGLLRSAKTLLRRIPLSRLLLRLLLLVFLLAFVCCLREKV
jgi:hypothetical protein